MKYKLLIINLFIGIFLIHATSKAQLGYEFLRTKAGARPSALGGAFVAVMGDVHSVYYNPSALATLNSRQVTFSYLNSFLDFQSGFVAYGFHVPKAGYFGIGSLYMDYGEFTQTDQLGNTEGTFGASSLLITADYASKLAENFYVGAAFKVIYATLVDYNSTAFAGDVGFLYRFPEQDLNIGFGVFNFGKVTDAYISTKDELPLNYRFGISKRLEHLPLMLNAEGYQYKKEDFQFIIGGEFTLTPYLFLRLSYNSVGRDQKIGKNGDKYAGVSIGMGLSLDETMLFQNSVWRNLSFDYTMTSAGEVGSLNMLSLSLRF